MRCVLIASSAAELLFYWADAAFLRRLRPPAAAAVQGPAVEDSLNTLFAPLIISCTALLEKLSDTYTCFRAEHGRHLHVLHMFGDCLYIAVNGDGTESEDDLRRTLFVLRRLVEAHCGLVTLDSHLIRKELRPADSEQRERVWSLLRGLLETYLRLREEDQSFAVEAVERLIHPQLCEQCIEFLERQVVQYINASPERGGDEVGHAFLLVHTKLLAFYSSRNASSIRPADLLILILLVQDLYPSQSAEEELGPQPEAGKVLPQGPKRSDSIPVSSPSSRGGAEKESDDQDTDDLSTPEVYYTPQPSPGRQSTGECLAGKEPCAGPAAPQGVWGGAWGTGRQSRAAAFPAGSESWSESPEPAAAGDADSADVQVAEDLLQTLEPLVPEASNPRRIFLDANLREGYCPLLPHTMHCLPLWPGISLVLLTKVSCKVKAAELGWVLPDLSPSSTTGPYDPRGRHLAPAAGWVLAAGEEAGRGAGGGSPPQLSHPDRAAAAHGQVCEEAERAGHPVAERLGGVQEQDILPQRAWEQPGAAAGSGHGEAAALLRVPPALPQLRQPEPVAGPAGPCPEADEGEAAGLAGLPAGEEQAQHHHGVISLPAARAGRDPRRVGGGGHVGKVKAVRGASPGPGGCPKRALRLLDALNLPHVPGGLSWPGALHLRRPHGWADDGSVAQHGGEVQLGAGQGASGRVRQEQGLVPGRAGPAIPAEGLHDSDAAGRRLLLLLLPLVRERAGLQAGGDGGARPLRRLRSHRDAGRRLLQEAAALLQQEPPGRGGEVLRAADRAPGHHPLRAGGPAGLRLGPAPLGAFPHPPALSRPRGWD
ncbi:Hermansky-Pudlak syndrome 1 protein isoform X1 [Cygnus olor]|uniref:Hermansky-Pudlak syndrome 1 protein isoform X1 n=1 Tax=Cygnus olor TaxID=8869 RepID=UPI001ADEAF01|nr:Hermansky-Pudlak syndrome 1 protein isoform X1 [Cygnus olor]